MSNQNKIYNTYTFKIMRRVAIVSLIFFLNIFFTFSVTGQNRLFKSSYHQKNFERNKIYDQTYNLWKYKNKWIPNKQDTLLNSYFVDDRSYKGLINYGLTFRNKDYRTFQYVEGLYMHFLKVEFEKARFNPNDSIIAIEGYVSGGWGDLALNLQNENSVENTIDVFLGEKTDTIKHCYYRKIVNEEYIETKLNNKDVDETTIIDSFPAFYFKNSSHYRTKAKGKRYFKIKGKVTKNTLLAFGGLNCYSEIFDIGAMIYEPDKNKQKRILRREEMEYRPLIVQNRLVADIEKEKQSAKEVNYYTFTEKAENYILKRQYAFAKESYLLLDKEYKTIFARDIHNAIRCAVLSRDFKNAFYFGKKLAQKGVEKKYFNSKILSSLRKNREWNEFISDYDSLFIESRNKKNINLKEQIEQLVEEDQKDYGLENRRESQVLYETTERVTTKLIELLKKEGYPSEEKIGVYVKNDTILIASPDYHVLIRHAIQQKPKDLKILNELLNKGIEKYEYDSKRSPNNVMFYNSCFHIYKGNLYNSKSCGKNDLAVKKIIFRFNNPNGFIMDYGNFIVSEYNASNPKEKDDYYNQNFNFIMKLTDDWEFYEK